MSKLIDRALFRLTQRMPCRIIADGDRPYLERYYVGTAFGWRVLLHRFVAGDPDPALHNHPWPKAVSFILSGCYVEEYLVGMRVDARLVRWFNYLTHDSFHRVMIEPGKHVWSLFCFRRGDTQPWGFRRTKHHYDYRNGKLMLDAHHMFEEFDYGAGKSDDDALLKEGKKWWEQCGSGAERRKQGRAWPLPEAPDAMFRFDKENEGWNR